MGNPNPNPQDPPPDSEYRYDYGNYDTYDNGNTDPDVSNPGVNLDNGSPDPEAARYDNNYGRDPCAGVSCPEIDCPTRPYIPQGECCPICPGGSQVAPVRPELQENYDQPPDEIPVDSFGSSGNGGP